MSNQSLNPEQVKKYLESLPESERAKFLKSNLNVDIQETPEATEGAASVVDLKEKTVFNPKITEETPAHINKSSSSAENKIVSEEILQPDNHLSAEEMKKALEDGINDPQKLMQSLIDRRN
jgi:hypothetical protein